MVLMHSNAGVTTCVGLLSRMRSNGAAVARAQPRITKLLRFVTPCTLPAVMVAAVDGLDEEGDTAAAAEPDEEFRDFEEQVIGCDALRCGLLGNSASHWLDQCGTGSGSPFHHCVKLA